MEISININKEIEIDEDYVIDWRIMNIVHSMVNETIQELRQYSKKEYNDEGVNDYMNNIMLAIADKIVEED